MAPEEILDLACMHVLDRASAVRWRRDWRLLAAVAREMRTVLIDHVRRLHCEKRGGHVRWIPLNESMATPRPPFDSLDLQEVRDRLAALDPRALRVIDFHCEGVFAVRMIARELAISRKAAASLVARVRSAMRGLSPDS